MKKFNLTGCGVIAALLLTACNDGMDMGDGTGTITPFVSYDSSVITARGAAKAASRATDISEITVDDLTINLRSEDGFVNEEFSAANFPTDKPFAVGKYTMTATYGDAEEEGFEVPAVYGEAQLSVNEGKATSVSLTATPSKAMVTLDFDSALLDYMTSVSATLHTPGGEYIDYASTETRPAYVKPGNVTLNVSFTKPNGKTGSMDVTTFSAEARYHYHVGVKLGGNGAGSVESLVITFDENLTQEDVTVDISDLVLTTPAPEVTAEGFTAGDLFTVVEGSVLDVTPRFNINARGGIAKATLTTVGRGLIDLGWPAEIDLANASPADQALLTSMGLKDLGLFRKPGNIAAVELGGVAAHIPATAEGTDPVEFTLVVTDKNGKTSEPVGFSVKVDRLVLELKPLEGYAYAGEETAQVLALYNGGDAQKLKEVLTVQYENERGVFADTEIRSVTSGARSAAEFIVEIVIPSDAKSPLRVQAKSASVTTEIVDIPLAPSPVVTAENVFGSHAWVTVSGDGYDPFLNVLTAQVSADGRTYKDAQGVTIEGNAMHIPGLTPGAANYVRVKMGVLISEPLTINTENPDQIQGGDMEGWTPDKKSAGLNSWNYNNPNSPWASNNEKGMSQLHSTAYRSGACTVGPTTENANSGNAAFVRTVGIGANYTTSFPGGSTTSKEYVAGELFLGSYDGKANYGVEFSTRPASLAFHYRYIPFGSNADKGLAEIIVSDAAGNVLASATKSLAPNSAVERVELPLTYARNAAKAAKISVRFRSSDSDAFLNAGGVNTIPNGNTGKQFLGATLYVDDVTLVY